MKKGIDLIVRLICAAKKAYTKKWVFLALSLCVFSAYVLVLGKLDLLPSPVVATASATPAQTKPNVSIRTSTPIVVSELPVKIEISKINLATSITNPTTTNIAALDTELLKGAVRYPTSAKLGEAGNVVLFGHSSYLPIVGNQAYKAFNDIQKLKIGDSIKVSSSGTVYTYSVRSVTKESTTDAVIPLAVTGRVLTLSTCDSFGAQTDRFVVVADFVESHSVSNWVEIK